MSPMEIGEDWVSEMEEIISQRQEKLRKINPNSPLLEIVQVTSTGIDYDFSKPGGKKYLGKTMGEGLKIYANDLKQAIRNP